jgi:hypothetical protein
MTRREAENIFIFIFEGSLGIAKWISNPYNAIARTNGTSTKFEA